VGGALDHIAWVHHARADRACLQTTAAAVGGWLAVKLNPFLATPSPHQVDAAGTLLIPSESVTDVYMRVAARHGVVGLSEQTVLENFRRCVGAALQGGCGWRGL